MPPSPLRQRSRHEHQAFRFRSADRSALLGVLTACGSTQKPASSGVSADAQRYSTIFYDAFDTVTQVIAYCDSEEEFSRQMDASTPICWNTTAFTTFTTTMTAW